MPNLTRDQLSSVQRTVQAAQARVRSIRERKDEMVGAAVSAAIVGGVSFGLGWTRGRFGEVAIVGVPVDIGAAAVLHGVAFLDPASKYAEHLHSAGNGALAVYLTTVGARIGDEMRKKAGGTGLPTLPPIVSNTSGALYGAPGQASGWDHMATYNAAMAAQQGGLV